MKWPIILKSIFISYIAVTWSSDNRVVWIGYSYEVGHKVQVIVEAMFCPF